MCSLVIQFYLKNAHGEVILHMIFRHSCLWSIFIWAMWITHSVYLHASNPSAHAARWKKTCNHHFCVKDSQEYRRSHSRWQAVSAELAVWFFLASNHCAKDVITGGQSLSWRACLFLHGGYYLSNVYLQYLYLPLNYGILSHGCNFWPAPALSNQLEKVGGNEQVVI